MVRRIARVKAVLPAVEERSTLNAISPMEVGARSMTNRDALSPSTSSGFWSSAARCGSTRRRPSPVPRNRANRRLSSPSGVRADERLCARVKAMPSFDDLIGPDQNSVRFL
jgi:hypothetical protein